MNRILGPVLLLLIAASPAARAEVTFLTPAPLNLGVSDDAYTGSLASMSCATLSVAGAGTVTHTQVLVSMSHTWVGDLVFKVVSPSNSVVTLMSRPGVLESADDGTATFGDSSNLLAAFRLTFVNGGAKNAENMGDSLADSGNVCADDGQCVYDPNPGAAAPGNLAVFNGQPSSGVWRLCVGDGGIGDVGTINQWGLILDGGALTVAPTSTDFGPTATGTTSAEQFVTLTNVSSQSVQIDAVTAANPPFARTASGTCGNSAPFLIGVGGSCTLSYTFAPGVIGPAMQSPLQIQTAGVGIFSFSLAGTGTLPDAIFKDGFD